MADSEVNESPSFLKQPVSGRSKAAELAELEKQAPVHDKSLKVVFVSGKKYRRAQDILGFIRGDKAITKEGEKERRDTFIKHLKVHDVAPDSKEALPAIYELLGGLIRTPAEQNKAEREAAEMRRKGKKKMIE